MHYKYKPLPGTLLRMYYDPERHLLRFQTQDGEPLPEYTDIDLMPRAASLGYRPLLVLAHSEGLIPTVPENFDYLRFFPYIHEDQTLRLWDVERGVDAPLKTKKGVGRWEPQSAKKRFPALFDYAKRLGYWKEF
ncbi:hypothetical protein FS837_009769 [Tulasnella sp. UAMH 9824]|nr:hypothetical protein FS837_009769 [Tulasnella sp. UAMH 9824]